jgi:hypothetical protein
MEGSESWQINLYSRTRGFLSAFDLGNAMHWWNSFVDTDTLLLSEPGTRLSLDT